MAKRTVGGRSSSSLFLIELIIAIGFFAVASAVCLQLFVRARSISTESADLARATLAAQSAADAFRTCDGSLEKVSLLVGGVLNVPATGGRSGSKVIVLYDSLWQPTMNTEEAAYSLYLTLDSSQKPLSATIELAHFPKKEQSIFILDVKTPGNLSYSEFSVLDSGAKEVVS